MAKGHAQPGGLPKVLRSDPFWLFVAVAGLLLHLLAALSIYTWYDRVLGWALLVIFIATVRSYLRNSPDSVPLLPLITFQFYMLYGVAQFSQEGINVFNRWYTPDENVITQAMLIAVMAEVGLLVMFAAGQKLSIRKNLNWSAAFPQLRPEWGRVAIVYGFLGVAVYFVLNTQAGLIPVTIRNIVQTVVNPYLALVLVLFFARQNRSRALKWLTLAMVAAMVLAGLVSSQLENIIAPVYLFIICSWIWGGQLRVKWVVAALAVFIVLSPVKQHYRELVFNQPPVGSLGDLGQRFSLWGEALNMTWSDPFAGENTIQAAAGRTSNLMQLAQVVDWVPHVVPYNRGAGMGTALLFWVPRAVWSGKPSISDLLNNRYAIAFGYSTSQGVQTSTFGIVQPADGYWDFGLLGAIGYTSFYGLLLGVLFGGACNRGTTATILTVVFSASFLQTLVSLQNVLASLFSLFVGAWLALVIIQLLSGASEARRPLSPKSRPVAG